MPVWLSGLLGALGKLLVAGLQALIPYWLGKSRQREAQTEDAIERLGEAHENVVRIRTDSDARRRLRDKFRGGKA